MSRLPIRFIHASDLHLDRPAQGLVAAAEPLRERLVDAAVRAGQRLFDCVLEEAADFLLLAGDVLAPRTASPRVIAFLIEQFERLGDRNVPVYWAHGEVDGENAWPQSVPLPENVVRFSAEQGGEIEHHRDGQTAARIVFLRPNRDGRLRLNHTDPNNTDKNNTAKSNTAKSNAEAFTIGLGHGELAASPESCRLGYLALGGRHARQALASTPVAAHYCGTHQGRCPQESGPHGCTAVEVDSSGRVRTRLAPTDVVRWQTETIEIDDTTTESELRRTLGDRLKTLRETSVGRDLVLTWRIQGAGPLADRLRRGALADELLADVQAEPDANGPIVWSASLGYASRAAPPAEWYQQETILGDYLRLAQQYQDDADLTLALDELLDTRHAAGVVGDWIRAGETSDRETLLREAAWLGADLLGGMRPDASGNKETLL